MTRSTTAAISDQRTAAERARTFLPGMWRRLMPLYDVRSRLARVGRLHRRGVEIAAVAPGQAVLDVGCGTGNLALAILAAQPAALVTGLDPDGEALRVAARKARRRGVRLELLQGFADRLPAADGSVDRVVSALALHHVGETDRAAFAREALRVLRPGGTVTIIDLAGGRAPQHRGHRHDHDHDRGRSIPALLTDAGFADAREVDHADHRFGRITFVQATRG
ncbi:class I SAM-dependent methyltransferase [Nocardioides aquiterrae]|uniref:class I SAM-dependent methyltransferase n=1 Tax=Nocardioides aquiterrae TaxID=203799 RepID=UPI0031DB393D